MVKMYYVYVLQSDKDKGLYIGFSCDLKRRYNEHCAGECDSTKHRLPMKLIYYESYWCIQDAENRETFLKSGAGFRFLDKQLRYYFQSHPRRKDS